MQGVGFRATACHVAASYEVTGWVRNESDGSVSLEVQGVAREVEAMLREVDDRLSRFIKTHEMHEKPDEADESGFVIRH